MKIATWNVNGIRARQAQVQDWIARERPDVVCLQEIKAAPDQIPLLLHDLEGYWCYWHGSKGYSGVALHVHARRRAGAAAALPSRLRLRAPDCRGGSRRRPTVASVYVPNGGKDFPAKMRFLEALDAWTRRLSRGLAGSRARSVRRLQRRAHRARRPSQGAQAARVSASCRRSARSSSASSARGLVDVGRALDPDNDGLFTWWAPWRNMRERNIGWRLDYVFASAPLAARATACPVQKEVGTSDHAPVVATFG